MTLKKTWRKLTPRESSKLERGDTVAVRLDSGDCRSARFVSGMYFLKTKVIFEGDAEPTIIAQSDIGSVNEIEPVLPDLKLEPGMVVRSREGKHYLVVLEDGSPGRKRLELLPCRSDGSSFGDDVKPFFPFRFGCTPSSMGLTRIT